jgi:ubiquinone/menaquinone biosynthesis C-methylase UbiE
MVGPAGCVVSADFSEPAIKRARSVVAALGLENVELVLGDIRDLEAAMLAGPFDLAFTRCFLMHQTRRLAKKKWTYPNAPGTATGPRHGARPH